MPISFGFLWPAEKTSFALRAFSEVGSSWVRVFSGVRGAFSLKSSDMVPRELRCARSSFSRSCRRAEAGFTRVGVLGSGVSSHESSVVLYSQGRWQLKDIPDVDERTGVLAPR